MDILTNFFTHNSISFKLLPKKKKWQIQQRWREHFATEVKAQTDKWSLNNIDWYTFSYNYTHSIRGLNAELQYDLIESGQFYFISSNEEVPAYHCIKGRVPNANKIKHLLLTNMYLFDMYIIDANYSWTMVFVHEDDIGPFFCSLDGLKS